MISKKNSSPEFKRFFRPKTGDLQKKKKGLRQNSNGFFDRKRVISKQKKKKKSQLAIHRNFLQAFDNVREYTRHRANTTFSNQTAL